MVIGGALALTCLALSILTVIISPAQANSQFDEAPLSSSAAPPARPLLNHLSIVISATTRASTNGATVYNGDWITYTLIIQNNGAAVTNLSIDNPLLANVLESVDCSPSSNCQVAKTQQTIVTRGGNVVVEKTTGVTWTFASLASGDSLVLTFWGRVTCQAKGNSFNNQAALTYQHVNPGDGFALTDPIVSEVQVAPPSQNGQFVLSAAPEFCSQDGPAGGTTDMDWGDFDNDGDLDAALVSYNLGVFVYENNAGVFELFWSEANFWVRGIEGVRWADFDGDGYLELLVSGDWNGGGSSPLPDGNSYGFQGYSYIFTYNNAADTFDVYDDDSLNNSSFLTQDGAWRAEIADFTGDNRPDIAMMNYWGGCTVELYRNQAGDFDRNYGSGATVCLFGPPYFSYNLSPGNRQTFSAAWGDYNNDGLPDLAVGHRVGATSQWAINVYVNNGGVLTDVTFIPVETQSYGGGFNYIYDLAWGDYDSDGRLDLAAAFSNDTSPPTSASESAGGFRIYHNDTGSGGNFSQELSISSPAGTIGAVDWADFDGDGQVELAVGEFNAPLTIYKYNNSSQNFALLKTLAIPTQGDVFSVRGVDHDNDGDLDLSFTNTREQIWLFTNQAPFLRMRVAGLVPSFVANTAAWGNVNGGYPDLLYGTSAATKLYNNNNNGSFSGAFAFAPNPPAQSAAFGNVDGDADLDIILGLNGQNQLHLNDGSGLFPGFPNWRAGVAANTTSLLFADIDQDTLGRPDLIVGNNGSNMLYMNPSLQINNAQPDWSSIELDNTRGVAWSYYDNDILPDFAAANDGQGVRIYRNAGYNNFVVAQNIALNGTRSVAWGDYDGDSDMDLAVGNYGSPNQLYRNNGGNLTLVWTAPVTRNTTSVAWGDWDNDGDPDLAVGNYNQFDQVYTNVSDVSDQNPLAWLWKAEVAYKTTGLAWGDYDQDGDLDLAISQDGSDPNGIYENSYALAGHLSDNGALSMPLPQNPTYLVITQPGNPGQVFSRTPPLTNSANLVIPISFTVFDPDGTRQSGGNAPGDTVKIVSYEYSLNDGGQWYPATVTPLLGVVTTLRRGQTYTVTWQAGQNMATNNPNQAVSDQARFRITMIRQNDPFLARRVVSPLQRVAGSTVSPPFRIRNIACLWPENPSIPLIEPSPPYTQGIPIRFWGAVQQWEGPQVLTFTWDFGGTLVNGVFADHSFLIVGTHVVTLTVAQPGCPNTRTDFVTTTVTIGSATSPVAYLPIILKSGSSSSSSVIVATGLGSLTLNITEESPAQVIGLQGSVQPGGTTLQWNSSPPDDNVLGYRIYRSKANEVAFQRLADIPASTTNYTDSLVTCGYTYFVTAYNANGESVPSSSSYYTPLCP
jgi:hypothetical protein